MLFRGAFVYYLCLTLTVVSSELLTVASAGVMTVGSAVAAGLFAGFSVLYCHIHECCNDRWISTDFTDLSSQLNDKVYGQHLVIDSVVKHLKAHAKPDPSKALALSFHGWTGTGKNYVARIVAEKMFKNGMKSKYVHMISATKEFPHQEMVSLYQDKLRDRIEKAVKECPRSLFIIDEIDKMELGIIDILKPYLDFYEHLDGVDYRKSTFFFLSNTGGSDIAKMTINHWYNNKQREQIKLKDMEEVIMLPALNSQSGLWHSELITKNLITAYIPFLPLERRHVNQCIQHDLIQKGFYKSLKAVPETKVQEIADQLTYYPEGVNVFSTTGCKRIQQKVDYIMEEL